MTKNGKKKRKLSIGVLAVEAASSMKHAPIELSGDRMLLHVWHVLMHQLQKRARKSKTESVLSYSVGGRRPSILHLFR